MDEEIRDYDDESQWSSVDMDEMHSESENSEVDVQAMGRVDGLPKK
jgi:hypothetical protein